MTSHLGGGSLDPDSGGGSLARESRTPFSTSSSIALLLTRIALKTEDLKHKDKSSSDWLNANIDCDKQQHMDYIKDLHKWYKDLTQYLVEANSLPDIIEEMFKDVAEKAKDTGTPILNLTDIIRSTTNLARQKMIVISGDLRHRLSTIKDLLETVKQKPSTIKSKDMIIKDLKDYMQDYQADYTELTPRNFIRPRRADDPIVSLKKHLEDNCAEDWRRTLVDVQRDRKLKENLLKLHIQQKTGNTTSRLVENWQEFLDGDPCPLCKKDHPLQTCTMGAIEVKRFCINNGRCTICTSPSHITGNCPYAQSMQDNTNSRIQRQRQNHTDSDIF